MYLFHISLFYLKLAEIFLWKSNVALVMVPTAHATPKQSAPQLVQSYNWA